MGVKPEHPNSCMGWGYGPWQNSNVLLIADMNNKSPLEIYNESKQKIQPGGTIFNQQPKLCACLVPSDAFSMYLLMVISTSCSNVSARRLHQHISHCCLAQGGLRAVPENSPAASVMRSLLFQ